MTEQVFDSGAAGGQGERGGFAYSRLLDGLRGHTSEWLAARRVELVRERRRLEVEEMAVLAVLDERGRVDDSLAAADGVSVRSVRERVETARALESLPEVAAAAYDGRLSGEQLVPAARLADPSSDREWAARAANTSPHDLEAQVRRQKVPSAREWAARRERRNLRWWWDDDRTFLSLRGDLPDLQGAAVEKVLEHLVDRMRPAKGDAWDTRAHRGADALVDLCVHYADVHTGELPEPLFVLHGRPGEPVTIGGMSLPDELVESLFAAAKIEVVVDDVHGSPVSTGPAKPTLAKRHRRAVLRRDGTCRYPGCDRRTILQVHHLVPKSWGGTDELANLVSVCGYHHAQLVPHGDYVLVGNPNRPDGLRLERRDQHGRRGRVRAPDDS